MNIANTTSSHSSAPPIGEDSAPSRNQHHTLQSTALRILKDLGAVLLVALNLAATFMPLPPLLWLGAGAIGMGVLIAIRYIWDKSVEKDLHAKTSECEQFAPFLPEQLQPHHNPLLRENSQLHSHHEIEEIAQRYETPETSQRQRHILEVQRLVQEVYENLARQNFLQAVRTTERLQGNAKINAKLLKTASSLDKIFQTVYSYFSYFQELKNDSDVEWGDAFGNTLSFSKTLFEWINHGTGFWRVHLREEEIEACKNVVTWLSSQREQILNDSSSNPLLLEAYQTCIDDFSEKIVTLERSNSRWSHKFFQESAANALSGAQKLIAFAQKGAPLLPDADKVFQHLSTVGSCLHHANKGLSVFFNFEKIYNTYHKLRKISDLESFCRSEHSDIFFEKLLTEKAKALHKKRHKYYLNLFEKTIKSLESILILVSPLLQGVVIAGAALSPALAVVGTIIALTLLIIALYRLCSSFHHYYNDLKDGIDILRLRAQRQHAARELHSSCHQLESLKEQIIDIDRQINALIQQESDDNNGAYPDTLNLEAQCSTLYQRANNLEIQVQELGRQWQEVYQKQEEAEERGKWRSYCSKLNCSSSELQLLRLEIAGWLQDPQQYLQLVNDLTIIMGHPPSRQLSVDEVLRSLVKK